MKSKLYEILHKYIGDYLFGFDKSQLEVAILSGTIDLKDVNVRPDKVNVHFEDQNMPFVFKAGMIGKLKLQYNLMSCLSNPFEVIIDDLQVILGPKLPPAMNPTNNDYVRDSDSEESYDPSNGINIHEQQLKFSFKDPAKSEEKKEDSGSSKDIINMALKNVTLTINRLHIRYEDDYYADQNPFAFGILCEKVYSAAAVTEWSFGSLDSNRFSRVFPQDPDDLILRETNLLNMRIYWKSMAEMYIPISLLQSTKRSPNQIFDAISLEDMRALMRQSFAEENLIDMFSIYSGLTYNVRTTAMEEALSGGRPRIKLELLFTKMQVNISPNIVNDIATFLEYSDNIKIATELRNYRPLRRPITKNKPYETEKRKRKRRLIARDWFFYGVWAIRLKKLAKTLPQLKADHERRIEEFKQISDRIGSSSSALVGPATNGSRYGLDNEDKLRELGQYMAKMRLKVEEEILRKAMEQEKKEKLVQGSQLTVKWEEVTLRCFGSDAKRIVINGSKQPILQLQVQVHSTSKCGQSPCADLKAGQKQYEAAVLIKGINLFSHVKNMTDSETCLSMPPVPRFDDLSRSPYRPAGFTETKDMLAAHMQRSVYLPPGTRPLASPQINTHSVPEYKMLTCVR